MTGSTAGSEGAVNPGNTVFTVAVDGDGTVTLTQTAPLDHVGMGNDQVIELPNNLINLDFGITIEDGDGDTDTDGASIDLGGNLAFNDDAPIAVDDNFNTVFVDQNINAAFILDFQWLD